MISKRLLTRAAIALLAGVALADDYFGARNNPTSGPEFRNFSSIGKARAQSLRSSGWVLWSEKPPIPAVSNHYLKVEAGGIVEMSPAEKRAVDQAREDALEEYSDRRVDALSDQETVILRTVLGLLNPRLVALGADPVTPEEAREEMKRHVKDVNRPGRSGGP